MKKRKKNYMVRCPLKEWGETPKRSKVLLNLNEDPFKGVDISSLLFFEFYHEKTKIKTFALVCTFQTTNYGLQDIH